MNAANERLLDELAAHWTEPALEILKASGMAAVSVEMELATWRTLKAVLRSELRWQRAFRFSTLVSFGMLMEQVLAKATILVARKFAPPSGSAGFQNRIRVSALDHIATAAERRIYAQLVRQPALHDAFRLPSRTDFFPRLRVAAVG